MLATHGNEFLSFPQDALCFVFKIASAYGLLYFRHYLCAIICLYLYSLSVAFLFNQVQNIEILVLYIFCKYYKQISKKSFFFNKLITKVLLLSLSYF